MLARCAGCHGLIPVSPQWLYSWLSDLSIKWCKDQTRFIHYKFAGSIISRKLKAGPSHAIYEVNMEQGLSVVSLNWANSIPYLEQAFCQALDLVLQHSQIQFQWIGTHKRPIEMSESRNRTGLHSAEETMFSSPRLPTRCPWPTSRDWTPPSCRQPVPSRLPTPPTKFATKLNTKTLDQCQDLGNEFCGC